MTSDDAAGPRLDDQLCFAIYGASQAMTAAYRDGLAAHGLTYTQYVALLALWEDDVVSMRDLCARLHLDSATLSPLLKRLEARGLVTRERAAADERTVLVSCTAQGRALREPVAAVQAGVEADTGLTGAELAELREELHAVAHRLRESRRSRTASGEVG
ncbi:MarR family transcriptional regulator [Nocardioides panacisoli]|uniref:MarR family winged helix-turn-helix transcriptional regulator n=1 Tax=Nocardioides panacisoli TaxID=627624 RepID=UPI001C635391|nr:MarR family transcriptional regulator [Nocardioides panacisoli]QYJ03329.1 MarR family transcriptional regulator [Nocardioides panacisoli]